MGSKRNIQKNNNTTTKKQKKKNATQKIGERTKTKCLRNSIKSHKENIKNLSNTQLTDERINLLSWLKFIPVQVMRRNLIRCQLLADFNQFAGRMCLHYISYGEEKGTHPCHVKLDWDPPVQPSVALDPYLEEVRFKLATINIGKSKHNLSPGE